jgi:DNA-binding transcriptional LysR family regulator
MMTFKQLEALFWIVQAGGFSQAAARLHTTQSAVSKRVHELEEMFETPLFDRSQRSAKLTAKGEEMFLVAKRLLEQRDAAIEQFQRPEILVRRIRIGVTELTAMTWLPRLVSAIQSTYPRVVIEPYVDVSLALRDKLLTDDVDMMIVPHVFEDHRLVVKKVGVVENVWMCKPGLVAVSRRLRMQDLARHRLLTQDDRSGTGQLYNKWLQSIGIQPENTILSNSLVTLIALTISGMGVSVLPKNCLQQMIQAGALQVLPVTPTLPLASYAAVYRAERKSAFIEAVATLAQDHCDFGTIFQSA